jgi:hypothetical protein
MLGRKRWVRFSAPFIKPMIKRAAQEVGTRQKA